MLQFKAEIIYYELLYGWQNLASYILIRCQAINGLTIFGIKHVETDIILNKNQLFLGLLWYFCSLKFFTIVN